MEEHPLVYEINTRCWLHDLTALSATPITLASIPDDQFASWQRLGFTHIWLMGVWECGPLLDSAHLDAAPSPYAITAYTVPSALGGNSGLAKFRELLHQHGLKLLLDFVPNHTSCAHPWVRSHPQRYVHSRAPRAECFRVGKHWIAHGKDPYFPAWVDTAQLDYRQADTRAAMIRELLGVAAQCDGVRCDMSMLLLNDVFARTWENFAPQHSPPPQNEFWAEAIPEVRRSHPAFLFLAEAYWDREQQLLDLGFDYAYDKRVYDHLIARNVGSLAKHLRSKTTPFVARTTHFLENHDEPRIASLLNFEEHRAASLLMLALPGMRLLHEGQLAGATIRASVHRRRRIAEPVEPGIAEWYDRLLAALKNSAVGRGTFELLPSPENVFALGWQRFPGNFDLALINLGPAAQSFHVPVAGPNSRITDLLGSGTPESPISLPPQAARLLNCREI